MVVVALTDSRRTELILTITEIKEEMLNDYHLNRRKEHGKKYQNNDGGQNNTKVSK